MSDSDELSTDIERQLRAIELKNEAHEITGGQMSVFEAEDIDPAIAEQFWENVVAYERAPRTTPLKKLEQLGVAMPAPDALSDEALSLKLWEVIDALARMSVILECTDHLSDRELYSHLWFHSLREQMVDMSAYGQGEWHIDPIGSGSEEDMLLYHQIGRAH